MRPPPDCRPSIGASAPKGTCRWLSPFGGSAVRTALNYNYHRAAGTILCRRPLSLRFDPPPFQSHVPPQNVKNQKPKKIQVYKKTSSEVRDFYLVKFSLTLIFQIG
ncbi:unnamed protein product [Brassica rapa subsp. narinosa]|uniref:(rape) hypothetical protein n=1 Tax=Brassica napus TaxID=3708 RepID=A0A816TEG8_BRANA|nr:unnamed protein product [Brassica napus]